MENNPNLDIPLYSVVVLVFHRTPELVAMARDCLASIKNSSPQDKTEIIIIDNGSTVRHDWEKECNTYIRFEKNMGISHGWNTGIKASRGKYITLLGDDTIVHDGWLEALQKAMDMPLAGLANVYVENLPQGIGIVENYKWFSHACVMLTQSTIRRIGYYDEKTFFPANFEDVDYSTRVMKAGLKLYVNYGSSIQHKEGKTVHAKDISSRFTEMKRRFIEKHGFDPIPVFYDSQPFPMR